MSLPSLQFTEPLASALIGLLQSNLPGVIDTLNASNSDSFTVDHPAQYLPFVPPPSLVQGGLPVVGFHRIDGRFEDDLQTSADVEHEYAIVAIVQNSDHETLVHQLERTLQAVAYVIQQDRLAGNAQGSGGQARTLGGAWSVNFDRIEWGPLLGDLNPTDPEAPPRTYLSFAGLVCRSKRREV